MRWLVLLVFVGVAGCATNKTCAQRADHAYRMCQQQPFQPTGDPESELMETSDELQMCRAEYQQSMALCAEGGGPKVKTSTISPIPTLE